MTWGVFKPVVLPLYQKCRMLMILKSLDARLQVSQLCEDFIKSKKITFKPSRNFLQWTNLNE